MTTQGISTVKTLVIT